MENGIKLVEEERGPKPVTKTPVRITEVLGPIEAPKGVEVLGKGAENSTRWIFDLECEAGKAVTLRLLDPRTKKRILEPELMGYSMTAASHDFYDARPIAHHDKEKGVFSISSLPTESGTFACRVTLDVMHTATR